MKYKTAIDLKREYWSRAEMYFTPYMIESLIREYGDKPATLGEALYAIRYNIKYIFWTVFHWRQK